MGEWYEDSFGEDYIIVYRHRNLANAEREIRSMTGWMSLPEGAGVLDVGCGTGRHAEALRALGYKVTGLDLSPALLNEARKKDTEGLIQWVQGDMRSIPFADGSFEAVVNWFTSFGYFGDDADNDKVLSEMSRVLVPGGKFLIDFLNAAHVQDNLIPHSERLDEATGLRISERRSLEGDFVVKRIEITPVTGEPRHYEERVRLIGLERFRSMAEQAGLTIEAVRGEYDGESYDERMSARLIMTGRKAE